MKASAINLYIKLFLTILTLLLSFPLCRAYRLHCEQDSLKIVNILDSLKKTNPVLGDRLVNAAKMLTGIPGGVTPENDSIATVYVNLHHLDNLGFINNALALAKASLNDKGNFEDYTATLENLSRIRGEDKGIESWHFYGGVWIVDNVSRGNLTEMTEYLPGGGFKTKTFDYISHHPDEFPSMKDSLTVDKIKMIEMGYRSHRIPHLKKQSSSNKELRELIKNGDIIMMLNPATDYDIYDIGVIEMKDGSPFLIHLSPQQGVVADDPYPMSRLFKLEGQFFYGYRWLRPTEQ